MNLLIKFPLLIDIKIVLAIVFPVAVVLVVGLVILFVFLAKKKKNPTFKGDDWLVALGGKENIKEVMAVGSRLSLYLNNKDNIDRDRLKELGVSSILVMSNKVTLVIEGQAERVANSINSVL